MFRSELPFRFAIVTLVCLNVFLTLSNHISIRILEKKITDYFEIPLPESWDDSEMEKH